MKKHRFCPNPACALHMPPKEGEYPPFYIRKGFYHTHVVGRVQKYQCKHCGKFFGDRTFKLDYFTKKSLSYNEIEHDHAASATVYSMARKHKCSSASIQNRMDRFARNSLGMLCILQENLDLREDLVADGFESFDCSQYFPNNINLMLGEESQYVYGTTHCTLRRKGRMTAEQKARRKELEKIFKAKPTAIRDSFAEALKSASALWNEKTKDSLRLITDKHKAYPLAIQRITPLVDAMHRGVFVHETHSSKIPRTTQNPLFSANYYDREIRKDLANHHRESKCFTRNVANGLMRLTVYIHYHNFLKPFRVKWTGHKEIKHSTIAGIDPAQVARLHKNFYTERIFITHLKLTPEQERIWLKGNRTPLKQGGEYVPRYARGL